MRDEPETGMGVEADAGGIGGGEAGREGVETPRTRRRARTREGILAVGRTLLLEKGVDGFTLREVARAADYSPSALYRHFRNKDELVAAVAMEGLRVLGEFLTEIPDDAPTDERLLGLGQAYLRFARESPEYFSLVFNRLSLPATDWEHLVRVAWPFTLVVEAFVRGVREGRFRETRGQTADVMALGFWSLAHGAATLRAGQLRDVSDDLGPFFTTALRTYLGGLDPATASSVDSGKHVEARR
jgi:AcrR family transcriptional regulator